MTLAIVLVFVAGYIFIAVEGLTRVNKTAVALLTSVICWMLFYAANPSEAANGEILARLLGETCEIIFFLMGAMTIVEVVDTYGGFNFVRERMLTRSKRSLLWRITLITFFLSSVLDNLTTAIVMIMVLRKLVNDKNDRILLACMVILAANSGGAFSPIGDVTTIMLWVKGNISSVGVLKELFLPALVSVALPAWLLQSHFKGAVDGGMSQSTCSDKAPSGCVSNRVRHGVFVIGVGGLIFVPVFRMLTGLPPFMGILFVLALLWIVTELVFRNKACNDAGESLQQRVATLLHKIDLSTILFFLGILMSVSALTETGVLRELGNKLDQASGGNPYVVTGIIGLLSSVVDNVPLVAACMGMYDIAPVGNQWVAEQANYVMDGAFWQLLAYCAGVGGSILIIGSAAGVVVMGLEKISFGWYLKRFSGLALVGYLAGIAVYALCHLG